jgi:hypothetical protein
LETPGGPIKSLKHKTWITKRAQEADVPCTNVSKVAQQYFSKIITTTNVSKIVQQYFSKIITCGEVRKQDRGSFHPRRHPRKKFGAWEEGFSEVKSDNQSRPGSFGRVGKAIG